MLPPDPAASVDAPSRVARINAWVDRGLELLGEPRPDAPARALRRFRRALRALRAERSVEPAFPTVLARAMVNVGNLAPELTESLALYDEAIALLQAPAENFPVRLLGATWLNRGTRLLRSEAPAAEEADENFIRAIEVLGALPEDPSAQRNLAAAWMNRAAIAAFAGEADQARTNAARCLEIVAPHESSDLAAVEIGLKARLLWLSQPEPSAGDSDSDWVEQASDAIDTGLAGIRALPPYARLALRGPAAALWRSGCAFYLRHMPQFLPELLREHLLGASAADFVSHYIANEAATAARRRLQMQLLTPPAPAGAAERLAELVEAIDALNERQRAQFLDEAEGAWLRARIHELEGREPAALEEWRTHLRQQPTDPRARYALESWKDHRGDESAALEFAEAGVSGTHR